jgi:hypothetical protein
MDTTMNKNANPNFFSWNLMPYLLAAGLCVGVIAGTLNYKAEGNVQLAPELADANLSAAARVEDGQQNNSIAREFPPQLQYDVLNSSAQVFVPPEYQNYQVAIAGGRLKTIINR